MKFALWLAAAATIPVAGVGGYALWTFNHAIGTLEAERFKLAGRELVSRLETKAADNIRGGAAYAAEQPKILADELQGAAAYLGLGAALYGRDGAAVTTVGEPWGASRGALEPAVLGGERLTATRVAVASCGTFCRRYAAASPIASTQYTAVFSLPPGPASAALNRLVLELLVAVLAALACALAIGLHVAGPLEATIRELHAGARQFTAGNFSHVIARGPPDELSDVVEGFNAMARELKVQMEGSHTRSLEGYQQFEEGHRAHERLQARLNLLEGLRAPASDVRAQQIVEWFELELRADGRKAVVTGDGAGWPPGSRLAAALVATLDLVKALPGPFDLALGERGFSLAFPRTAGAPHDLSAIADAHAVAIDVRLDADRTTVNLSLK